VQNPPSYSQNSCGTECASGWIVELGFVERARAAVKAARDQHFSAGQQVSHYIDRNFCDGVADPSIDTYQLDAFVGWQVGTLWVVNPDYLPYFNEAVAHPDHVLVDSDLDWGQDLRRLEHRLAELAVAHLSLAYRGTADLSREALPPFEPLLPWHAVTGWIAISALAREHDPAGYAWLKDYRPRERVGKTIDLYYIPEPPAT